jgi:hypothetical protein
VLKSGRVAIRYGTYGQWTTITYQLLNAVRTGPLQISNEYMYIKISVQNIIANALFNKPRRWLCSPVHVTLSSRNPTVTPEIHNATPYDSIHTQCPPHPTTSSCMHLLYTFILPNVNRLLSLIPVLLILTVCSIINGFKTI